MKVIKKGYTLKVVSWENDADNYNTHSKTVSTKEEAKVWYDMMQLCVSKNNKPKGVIKLGNSYDGFTSAQTEVAAQFIKDNHTVLLPKENISNKDDETLAEWFCDLVGELLGYGEGYACRVMESCVVTYSPEDVSLEEVKF